MTNLKADLSKTDTVLLVGGLGKRLKSIVHDKPKCLVSINGKPFLDILLGYLTRQGLRRFILCVGYLGEQVIDHLNGYNNCEILFSVEKTPLGTAGALKKAQHHINSSNILVMNGDSFVEFFVQDLIKAKKDYFGSILLCQHHNTSNFGRVGIDRHGFVTFFQEKVRSDISGLINAGIYYFNKKIMDYIPKNQKSSIEYDILPALVKQEKIIALKTKSELLDIGTPKRIIIAEQYFRHR